MTTADGDERALRRLQLNDMLRHLPDWPWRAARARLPFRFRSPICGAIPQADFRGSCFKGPLRWRGSLSPSLIRRGSTGKDNAVALPDFTMRQLLEVGRAFRPPVASLEPEDGALHLRRPQLDPHHRPRPDRAAAAPGAEGRLRHRRQGRPGAVRRHQAPGGRGDRRRGQALGAVFRQLPLARRHADQLEDHFRLDLAPAQARRACSAKAPRASPRRSA